MTAAYYAVILSSVVVAVFSVTTVWALAIYTLADSFQNRWRNRFTDAPAPDWIYVFPRFALQKAHRRQILKLSLGAAVAGFVIGAVLALAAIGAEVVFA